jgi:hypothetical protein
MFLLLRDLKFGAIEHVKSCKGSKLQYSKDRNAFECNPQSISLLTNTGFTQMQT